MTREEFVKKLLSVLRGHRKLIKNVFANCTNAFLICKASPVHRTKKDPDC